MLRILRSGRFYFWPIVTANTVAMAMVAGGSIGKAIGFSVVVSSLASYGFLINDLWDRDADRVNKATRFEHSEPLILRMAMLASGCFLVAGLGLAYWLGRREFFTALVIAFGLSAYTLMLRKLFLLPTIVAAILATAPLWSPLLLWAANAHKWRWMFVSAVVIMVAARETLMDARDQRGDAFGGRDTIATLFGQRIARFVGAVLTISATVPFIVAIVYNTSGAPAINQVGAIILGAIVLALLLKPTLGIISDVHAERASIQKYVKTSRLAMALIPFIVLLWSH
jgi:4-hydroxybenzoate polyprenyltransferase